jgi:hypothetical protein
MSFVELRDENGGGWIGGKNKLLRSQKKCEIFVM